MGYWLFKEEPEHYSYADLEREGETLWDGVTNNLARKHLRQVRGGDRILFYATGKEKAVVAEMQAMGEPVTGHDPRDSKAVAVRVAPVRRLQKPVPLSWIKNDPTLAAWELVRLPRLSIMPMTKEQWDRVKRLARS